MNNYNKYLNYFKSKKKKPNYIIEQGVGNIMLSASHSVEQTRNGELKYGEYETGALVKIIHDKTNCHIIYKAYNENDDANFDSKCKYKDALIKYIKDNNIKYLIDLHQLSSDRNVEINIGTNYYKNLNNDKVFLNNVINAFKDFNISIDNPFAASNPNTVSANISNNCKIPTLQIEMNTKLLNKDYKECCFESILDVYTKIIKEYQ